jgi:hypothetical protein
MKKFLFTIFSALILVGCQSVPEIKHGPYCSSDAAGMCHRTGIAYGTDAMQACIKDVQRRCAQEPEVKAKPTEFQKCISDVRSAALSCTLRCMGAGGNCHQICDDREIAQIDRCEARQKGISHQYSPPTQPQQIIIQQQQPISNPNACIQDGGSVFCPNHPSNRSTTPLYRPVFK